jgi:hypothetical protein
MLAIMPNTTHNLVFF